MRKLAADKHAEAALEDLLESEESLLSRVLALVRQAVEPELQSAYLRRAAKLKEIYERQRRAHEVWLSTGSRIERAMRGGRRERPDPALLRKARRLTELADQIGYNRLKGKRLRLVPR